MMFANDTNILIYSIDPADPVKHQIAERILRVHSLHLYPFVLQSLTEFYFATTRKKLLSNAGSAEFVADTLHVSPVVTADSADALRAMQLHRETGHQFFDCLLLATAARSGCTTLFSEDFQHNRTYGTITVRDPFRLSPAELDDLLQ